MRETKAARIAELEAHVAALQEKFDAETSCGCSYDDKDDVCMGHSPKLATAEARAEKAEAENWQLRQACGYSIPADKETPQNPFKCGTCEASHIRAEKATAECEEFRDALATNIGKLMVADARAEKAEAALAAITSDKASTA